MPLAGRRVIAAPLRGMVGDVGVDAAQELSREGRLRRPTIQGNFHNLGLTQLLPRLYTQKLVYGVALYQA